jgi:hypothetical protein
MADQGAMAAPDALHPLTITLDTRDPLQARFIAAYLAAADGPSYARLCLLAGYQAASAAPPGIVAATLRTGLAANPAPGGGAAGTTGASLFQTAGANTGVGVGHQHATADPGKGSMIAAEPPASEHQPSPRAGAHLASNRQPGPVGARLFGLD